MQTISHTWHKSERACAVGTMRARTWTGNVCFRTSIPLLRHTHTHTDTHVNDWLRAFRPERCQGCKLPQISLTEFVGNNVDCSCGRAASRVHNGGARRGQSLYRVNSVAPRHWLKPRKTRSGRKNAIPISSPPLPR